MAFRSLWLSLFLFLRAKHAIGEGWCSHLWPDAGCPKKTLKPTVSGLGGWVVDISVIYLSSEPLRKRHLSICASPDSLLRVPM